MSLRNLQTISNVLWYGCHQRTHSYRIINRHSGMLLCVQSRTDRENHRLIHYHHQALNFQWWEVQAFRQDEFKVVNKKSRKVLTAKDGSVVQQTPNESSQIQLWNIIPLEQSGFIGEYQIRNVNASKLLCIKTESISDNGRAVVHDDRTGTVHEEFSNFQWWRLFVRGWDKGGFVLQNCHSGKMLCISQRSMNNGTKVIQYQDQELFYQKWRLESVSPDRKLMKIANYNSGLMLSVQDSAQHNDAQEIQYEDKNLPFLNQLWEFIKLSEEINLKKLIKLFNSEPEYVDHELRDEDLGTNFSPELLQWYKNFIKMFMLEILAVIGVFPLPSQEQLTAIRNHLILGNSSILGTLQAFLETEVSFDTIVKIAKLIWEEDLWNQIFRHLFEQVWSLPTLAKATAIIASLITARGRDSSYCLPESKSSCCPGILYSTKPTSESSSDNDDVDLPTDPESDSLQS